MGLGIHDPKLSCKHQWHPVGKKDKLQTFVCGEGPLVDSSKPYGGLTASSGCGAFAVFDDRNKIVEYDRTYNWGRRPTVDIDREVAEDRLQTPKQRRA